MDTDTRGETPKLAPCFLVHGINMPTVTGDIDGSANHDRRRCDVPACSKAPPKCSSCSIECMKVVVVAANVDGSIDHGRRRCHATSRVELPVALSSYRV